jgi:hypothetical protein
MNSEGVGGKHTNSSDFSWNPWELPLCCSGREYRREVRREERGESCDEDEMSPLDGDK